jgi:hypothetical protein
MGRPRRLTWAGGFPGPAHYGPHSGGIGSYRRRTIAGAGPGSILVARGTLIASVPNFGHWYARGRVLLGLFDYDQRGVLDQGHVRFFTRRGLLRRLRNAGYQVVRSDSTGLPLEVLTRSGGTLQRIVRLLDRLAVLARPTLFAYQFVVQCETSPEPTVVSDS